MKIRTKLLAGFMAVAAVVAIAGYVGITTANGIMEKADVILDEKMPIIDASMELVIAAEAQQTEVHAYMLGETDAADGYAEAGDDFATWLANLKAASLNVEQLALAASIEADYAIIDGYAQDIMTHMDEGDAEAAWESMELLDAKLEVFMGNLDALEESAAAEAEEAMIVADAAYASGYMLLIATIIIGVIAAIVIGLVITNFITRPLNRVEDDLKRMATGDISAGTMISTKDEIGSMASSLNTKGRSCI